MPRKSLEMMRADVPGARTALAVRKRVPPRCSSIGTRTLYLRRCGFLRSDISASSVIVQHMKCHLTGMDSRFCSYRRAIWRSSLQSRDRWMWWIVTMRVIVGTESLDRSARLRPRHSWSRTCHLPHQASALSRRRWLSGCRSCGPSSLKMVDIVTTDVRKKLSDQSMRYELEGGVRYILKTLSAASANGDAMRDADQRPEA